METTLKQLFAPADSGTPREGVLNLALRYPYFAPAQYLVALHAKDDQEAIVQRTALYFPNNLWLQDRLKGIPEYVPAKAKEEAAAVTQPVLKVAEKDELPIFQAYHTVDYFASQGIRISAEALQTDKLGRQLRSFTDWLKTMKKLPAARDVAATDLAPDPRITRFAESSLKEDEVLTESMAEVLARQGRRDKALEIYEKLSLLYPQKSAYFAAKIEALKAV